MTVITECSRCDEEARIDPRYTLDFNPHDITEGGEVKTHLVEHEMSVDSSFARCRNGHRDPAAFIVGAIADHLREIRWDEWESEEQYRAETTWAGGTTPLLSPVQSVGGGVEPNSSEGALVKDALAPVKGAA